MTLQSVRALDEALASVDPHAANALRSRFAQEPRLLTALLVSEGQVNHALLRSAVVWCRCVGVLFVILV